MKLKYLLSQMLPEFSSYSQKEFAFMLFILVFVSGGTHYIKQSDLLSLASFSNPIIVALH